MPYFYGIDSTYFLVLIGVVISLVASAKVKSAYAEYAKVRSIGGVTADEVAQRILYENGIRDVSIEQVAGELTDHYDPRGKVLRLSESVYNSTSVAAIGVAAHECGHAIQHAKGYTPIRVRNAIVSVANIGARLSWPMILLGLILGSSGSQALITIGIWMFAASVLFQLVTLPVEFNASNRAVACLSGMGILQEHELAGAKKVLRAAALTYVAAAAAAILQLIRLILLFGKKRD